MKRIGIICSGGDSQGMNVAIKCIVNSCELTHTTVVGYKYGFKGLVENDFEILTNKKVENIADQGGCYLKVSRYSDFLKPEVVEKAAERIKENKIDGIILLGGDGSFRGGKALAERGVNIVGVPATIDNDLFYTEKSLGFDTAVNNAVAAVDNMRQSIEANDRGLVVGTMGRYCGSIALSVAAAVNADAVVVNEVDVTLTSLAKDVKRVVDNGCKSPVVIVAEGVKFSVEEVRERLQKDLLIPFRSALLGYIQRGGAPSVTDRVLAMQFSVYALELLKESKSGNAVGLKNGSVFHVPFKEAIKMPSNFNMELYHQLRGLHGLN